MRVGMIGVGRMGAGMAANLLQAGHELCVYNRSPEKAAALIAQGHAPRPASLMPAVAMRC